MTQTADKLTPFLATSAVLHVGLFALAILAPVLFPKSAAESWGNSSTNGIKVGMADSLPGIPLPSPPVVNEAAKPSDTKTLHPADVAPKTAPKEPPKPAEVKIPERGAKTQPKPQPQPARAANANAPETAPAVATNAIPGDATGRPPLPVGGAAGTGQASFGGDGAFGSRYPEYVTNMTRAIHTAWVRPGGAMPVGASKRVYVKFTITKSGSSMIATNVALDEKSGFVPLDRSALLAVSQAKLPPFPAGFNGSSVDVRFYFDYTR